MRTTTVIAVLALLTFAMVADAAMVGYVAYGGLEDPAVNLDDPWVRMFNDAGFDVALVKTTDLLEPEVLAPCNALYIPDVIAFTESEFAAIQRYVAAGGWVLLQGGYSATAKDNSGQHKFVKGQYAWKIIYLDDGACRTGLLPVTGAGSTQELVVKQLRIARGNALTENTPAGVLDFPLRPNGKPYSCFGLHYFPRIGARALVTGIPQTDEENDQPSSVALAVTNDYGAGHSLWLTMPLAQMAIDGVDFASDLVTRVIAAIADNAPPKSSVLASVIPSPAEALADAKAYDLAFRGGKGYSDDPDSSMLGWGEASRLLMYMRAWKISKDTYWLDRVVDHFDRMIANLSDPDEDGYLGWQTIEYSDALAWPSADNANKGSGTIGPKLCRARANADVTGHAYTIEFTEPTKYQVSDDDLAALIARGEPYSAGETITVIPGVKTTISGAPAKGDKFHIRTEAVLPLEWAVHDGTITYPIALFIETVHQEPGLGSTYVAKATEYTELLTTHFLEKWESCWVEAGDAGFLKWAPVVANPYLRSLDPDEIPEAVRPQPHNQYLALGRTYMIMAEVVENERLAAHYLDVATRMAKFFHSKLRRTGDAWTFAYWDSPEEVADGADDFGHGGLSLSFCIEAASRNIVFSAEDMQAFSNTLLDQIWDGSLEAPQFSDRVDGSGKMRAATTGNYWFELCARNDEVWKLGWAVQRVNPDNVGFLTLYAARTEIALSRPEVALEPPAAP